MLPDTCSPPWFCWPWQRVPTICACPSVQEMQNFNSICRNACHRVALLSLHHHGSLQNPMDMLQRYPSWTAEPRTSGLLARYAMTEVFVYLMQGLDSSDEQSFIDTLSEVSTVPCCSGGSSLWQKRFSHARFSWQDLNKLNEFFMNREEDIVIRLQDLEDRSNSISTPEEQQHLKSAFVKLHGEHVSSDICLTACCRIRLLMVLLFVQGKWSYCCIGACSTLLPL